MNEKDMDDMKSIFVKSCFRFFMLTVGILMLIGMYIAVNKLSTSQGSEDQRTMLLCREYANRDHEKEISPQRYEWLGEEFVNSYDWYGSCINHIKRPVAL